MSPYVNEEIPGVVIRFRTAELRKVGGKKVVNVVLDAEVHDEEVWEAARKKLDGMKIYTVNDFQTELLHAVRKENEELTKRNEELEKSNKRALDENRQMKAALSVLGRQLESG